MQLGSEQDTIRAVNRTIRDFADDPRIPPNEPWGSSVSAAASRSSRWRSPSSTRRATSGSRGTAWQGNVCSC